MYVRTITSTTLMYVIIILNLKCNYNFSDIIINFPFEFLRDKLHM